MLLRGPRAHGFSTELWTLSRVAEAIKRHFGVEYHPSHNRRVLASMGWSCQKPERRAREREARGLAAYKKSP